MAEQQAKTIDERFDEVTQAFLDQRNFTASCCEKLLREFREEVRDAIGESESRLTQSLTQTLTHEMDRRFTRNDLLLTEILNEVKALSASRLS